MQRVSCTNMSDHIFFSCD